MNSRCWVEISRSRVAANYRAVRDAALPASVLAVVKANAYGHGAIEVSRILAAEGVEWLAVSSVAEGVALRQAGLAPRILVMAGVLNGEHSAVAENRLTPVIHSLEELPLFSGPVHLKLDTGLNRLGTLAAAEDIARAFRAAPHVHLEGILSHFASAADFTGHQTEDQVHVFEQKLAALDSLGIHAEYLHLSSTNAIAYPRPGTTRTLARPGHAIYGYVSTVRGPARAPKFRVQPALAWKTRIIAVKDVPAGARIGYGGSHVTEAPTRIAVLAAGYADGLSHRLSNKGKVIAGGHIAPILGTVSMDLTTIDITATPSLKPGDVVTLLGREGELSLDAQQIARTAGTISYNVLCGISARVDRIFVA
jgi:alanine racemase